MQIINGEPVMRFSDDPMFKRVMSNAEICRGVIERVVGRPIGKVIYHNTEQEQRTGPREKVVRMDSYLVESNGCVFDVEMQVGARAVLPLRLRGYQYVLDASTLMSGDDYSMLRESYIVFICMQDPFRAGLPVYTFERACVEQANVPFACRAHWRVLNASAYDKVVGNVGLASLLRYIYTEDAPEGDALLATIASEVEHYNDDKEWVRMMFDSITVAEQEAQIRGHLKGLEEGRAEGREEGRAEGRAEGREQGEDRYAKLSSMLLEQGRIEDLKRANSDLEARKALFEEFGL